jgi:RNA polymerase sigma-70 factor (ECF subfamily)
LFDLVGLVDDKSEKAPSYAAIGRELGMSVSAIKSARLRLRKRYGQFVREEVAHTISKLADLDAELRYLRSVIGA